MENSQIKKNSPKGVNRTTSESKYNREKREFISMLEKLNVFIFKVKSLIICFMFVKIQLYKHCNSKNNIYLNLIDYGKNSFNWIMWFYWYAYMSCFTQKKNNKILGLDNLSNYYDVKLKKKETTF